MAIAYTLIRTKRKTIAICITKEGTVEVRAPLKALKHDVDQFVQAKREWIEKHLAVRKCANEQKATFSLQYGDTVLYRGKECKLVAKAGNHVGFSEDPEHGEFFYMPENLTSQQIKMAVIQVYKMLAKNILTNKTIQYAQQMGLSPTSVKVNSAKTHWGSCSGQNRINFSWRLVLAEDAVIDYVVVHELAHIKEHNHSPRFWQVVSAVFPDYDVRRQALRDLQQRLSTEQWDE